MAVAEERTRQKKSRTVAGGNDMISNIPDELIEKILSYLPTVEAVRTCLLVKSWRNIWYSVPTVSFSDDDNDAERFPNFVDEYIEHRKTRNVAVSLPDTIERFKIKMDFCGTRHRHYLDEWLSWAVENKIKELCLLLSAQVDEDDEFFLHYYSLPRELINATHLTVLELAGVELDSSAATIALPSLKSLTMCEVRLAEDAENDVISHFVLGCPLEKLILDNCYFFNDDDLRLVSSTLKFLQLKEFADQLQLVQIEAENLEFLEIADIHFEKVNLCVGEKIANLSFSCFCDSTLLRVVVKYLPLIDNLTLSADSYLKHVKIWSQIEDEEMSDENDDSLLKLAVESYEDMSSVNVSLSIEPPHMLTAQVIRLQRHGSYDPKLIY